MLSNRNFYPLESSSYNIETLQKSLVWRIERSDLFVVYEKFIDMHVVGRIILGQLSSQQMNRIICMLKMAPEERYKDLIEDKRNLINLVQLKHLASYIGITP